MTVTSSQEVFVVFEVYFCLVSGQRRGSGSLSAHDGPGVAQHLSASNPQNAAHARTPGPQQDAALLPRHERERQHRRTGESAGPSPGTCPSVRHVRPKR